MSTILANDKRNSVSCLFNEIGLFHNLLKLKVHRKASTKIEALQRIVLG